MSLRFRTQPGDRFMSAFLGAWACGSFVITGIFALRAWGAGDELGLGGLARLALVVFTVGFPLTLFLGLLGWLMLRFAGSVGRLSFSIVGLGLGIFVAAVFLPGLPWSSAPMLGLALGGMVAALAFQWIYHGAGSAP